jgi:hypothetical protein
MKRAWVVAIDLRQGLAVLALVQRRVIRAWRARAFQRSTTAKLGRRAALAELWDSTSATARALHRWATATFRLRAA